MAKKKQIKRTKSGDKVIAAKRRQEILKLIIEAGHPRAISQSSLAKHYGVSQVAISKDIQALAKEVKDSLPNDAELVTHVVMESAIKALSKSNDVEHKFKAAKLIMDWNNYLFEIGKQKRAPREHKIEGEIFNNVIVNIIAPETKSNTKIIDLHPVNSLEDKNK